MGRRLGHHTCINPWSNAVSLCKTVTGAVQFFQVYVFNGNDKWMVISIEIAQKLTLKTKA